MKIESCLRVFVFFVFLSASPIRALAEYVVAGCDHVGTYCDIHPRLTGASKFAIKVDVLTAQEAQRVVASTTAFIDQTKNVLLARSRDILNVRREVEHNMALSLGRGIQDVYIESDAAGRYVERALEEEIQRLSLQQICEDNVIPEIGTPNRRESVRSLSECIFRALDHWRNQGAQNGDANPGENRLAPAVNGPQANQDFPLTRAQISYLLHKLNSLENDPDFDQANRALIRDIREAFAFFNFI